MTNIDQTDVKAGKNPINFVPSGYLLSADLYDDQVMERADTFFQTCGQDQA